MTPNDFLKIIQDSIHKRYEPVPTGWYCTEDLKLLWKMCATLVLKKINHGKENGLVTEKKFFVKKNGGRKIPYYYFHDKKHSKSKN